jgi:hypothetical protein
MVVWLCFRIIHKPGNFSFWEMHLESSSGEIPLTRAGATSLSLLAMTVYWEKEKPLVGCLVIEG